ncbi:MAG: ribosomal protein L7/L12 [Henriciella sp.]|uniref:ribosomal protein L7/L12 n=1 Tax=Henriciella sp. TaxID=1968823 RepID=UPI003C76A69F
MDDYLSTIFDPAVLITIVTVAVIAFLLGAIASGSGTPTESEKADISTAMASLSPSQKMQVDAAIDARKKIEAIRIVRGATGLGLKHAKMGVEARMRERDLTDRV